MIGTRKERLDGQPLSVDDTIDEIARKALADARRREQLQRLRDRENKGATPPC